MPVLQSIFMQTINTVKALLFQLHYTQRGKIALADRACGSYQI